MPLAHFPQTPHPLRVIIAGALGLLAGGDAGASPHPQPDPLQLERGRRVYRQLCAACHMPDGRGVPTVTPPLRRDDAPLSDRERAIRAVLHGLSEPIVFDGIRYETPMPPLGQVMDDRQVADVLTFVFHRWGEHGESFDPKRIAALRANNPTP